MTESNETEALRCLAEDMERIDKRTVRHGRSIDGVIDDVDHLENRVETLRIVPMTLAVVFGMVLFLAAASFVFALASWHRAAPADDVPADDVAADDVAADDMPASVTATATADTSAPTVRGSGSVTPLADLIDARDSVEQAHEGIGNVIKNDLSGDNTCGDRCYAAMQDARHKNLRAWHELDTDVLNIRTWDNDQTVAHGFDSADYWLAQLEGVYDIDLAKHAEYQLGILRDVLRAQVTKRTTPTTTTTAAAATTEATTTTVPYPASHIVSDDLSAGFVGWATENVDTVDLPYFTATLVAQLNDTPAQAPCFVDDVIPDTCPPVFRKALDEWTADCFPEPRGAALVVCFDGDGDDSGPVAP